MKFAMQSDVGLVRKINEDSLTSAVVDEQMPVVFAAVADGVGGYVGGEVASRLATNELQAEVLEMALVTLNDVGGDDRDAGIRALLARGFERAQSAIRRTAEAKPELTGMASTLTAVLLVENDLFVAHVGDSRAYHWHQGVLTQVSEDHSLVAFMVKNGSITVEEARNHPHRNVLTQALGSDLSPMVEQGKIRVDPGDFILLCTDGLSAVVSDEELSAAIISAASVASVLPPGDTGLSQSVADLVSLAKDRGGPDNITLILMYLEEKHSGGPADDR